MCSSDLLVENTYWHPTRTEDPAVQWLRTAVLRACELLDGE